MYNVAVTRSFPADPLTTFFRKWFLVWAQSQYRLFCLFGGSFLLLLSFSLSLPLSLTVCLSVFVSVYVCLSVSFSCSLCLCLSLSLSLWSRVINYPFPENGMVHIFFSLGSSVLFSQPLITNMRRSPRECSLMTQWMMIHLSPTNHSSAR